MKSAWDRLGGTGHTIVCPLLLKSTTVALASTVHFELPGTGPGGGCAELWLRATPWMLLVLLLFPSQKSSNWSPNAGGMCRLRDL